MNEELRNLRKQVETGDKTICKSIIEILRINAEIIEKSECSENNIINLRNNFSNLNITFNGDNKEVSKDVIEKMKFIFNNIDYIWPISGGGHYVG